MHHIKTLPIDLDPLLTRLATEVTRRRMEAPAIFFLEMYKPLTGLAHTAVLASEPLLTSLFGTTFSAQARTLLASRDNIERLITCIEETRGL